MYDYDGPGSTITIDDTTFRGLEDRELGVNRFLGIPYALPPIGEYRFQKPRALPQDYRYGQDGHLDCRTFPAICPQPVYKMNDVPMPHPKGTKFSEDCLYVNIWVPSGDAPKDGWPVMSWIHGGWYQTGDPFVNPASDPGGLISQNGAGVEAIVVTIGYRLNIFGFLASEQLKGNFGLWDQRMALEWIYDNIHYFGGNPDNMTLVGLSAGANAVHQQINHDFFVSKRKQIFKRAIMYSNAISAQSKLPSAAQTQFDEVCDKFNVDSASPYDKKLDALRAIGDTELASKLMTLKYHTFRHVTDDEFISPDLVKRAQDGTLAREFERRGFRLIIGEVENEESVYRAVNPPRSRSQFIPELENYYSKETSKALFERYPFQGNSDEEDAEAWKDHFGRIVAASQVRAPTRRLCSQLAPSSARDDSLNIFRYRISMRLKILTEVGIPESFGIGHGMDQDIWWYRSKIFRDKEAQIAKSWLAPIKKFVEGQQDLGWGTKTIHEYRRLCPDGTIQVEQDSYWDEYQAFANVLMPNVTTAQKL